jgi:two-component system LytT family response regulator
MTDGRAAPFRAVIADDEPPARLVLRRLLAKDRDFDVVAECAHGEAVLDACERTPPDVLFLDVQMPGLDGFAVLAALGPERVPEIVFVTAFDRYALRAFEAHALDYLLKPFSDARFADVVGHVRRRLRDRRAGGVRAELTALAARHEVLARRLVIRDGGRTLILPWDDIDWIEAEDYCVRFHTARDRPLVRGSLQSLQVRLDPAVFVRIHRSAIVNVRRVREVRPLASGDHEVVLATGVRLRLSRTYRKAWDLAVGPSSTARG